MSTHLWHLEEFERISSVLRSRATVRSVGLYGSVESGTHDEYSDLDISVLVRTLLDIEPIPELFISEDILGQERYVGEESALFRLLLRNGRRYDIKFFSDEEHHFDRKKVSLPGTDEFWFVLHEAHHALARERHMSALDLVFSSYRQVTQSYWQVDESKRASIRENMKELKVKMNSDALFASVAHIARLASVALNDSDRSAVFLRIIGE